MAMAGQMAGALNTQPSAAPPPLPNNSFFVAINGQQSGPLDINTLAARARDGSLTPQTLVWKQGMTTWVPASSVPELQAVLTAVPPPLPR
jgi:hypothetical protein